jgi:probable rRNA maturation factor
VQDVATAAEPKGLPAVDIGRAVRRHPVLPLSPSALQGILAVLRRSLHLEDRPFSLALVDDARMEALNEGFLGLVGPTNVLSFEDDSRAEALGEVVLNVDAVMREARLYGQDPLEHMGRLLAHGLLHLAGLQHGPEMDEAVEGALLEIRGA